MIKATSKYINTVLALFLLLTSALAQADKASELDNLMEMSGINTQMGSIPEQFNAGLQQGATQAGAPQEFADNLVQSFSGAISSMNILGEIRSALDSGMTESEMAKLNEWYSSDLGQKVTALEVKASSNEEAQYVASNLDGLLANHERVGMARRIEDALGGSDLTVTMMKSMQLTMVNAMMGDAPKAQRDAVYAQIDQQMDLAIPQIKQMALASYVHTYSPLSDSDLNAYLEFLSQPEAAKFYDLTVSSVGASIGKVVGSAFSGE